MTQTQTGIEARDLEVSVRQGAGKGVARKIRKDGSIPGVFYGFRLKPINLSLDPKQLAEALKTERKRNTILKIVSGDADINGKLAMVKEVQRHPLSRDFLHVDLIEVYTDRPVKAMIPIHVTGHAKGIEDGGTLDQRLRSIEVRAAVDKLPVSVSIDVTDLGIGDAIRVGQLPFGEGVEVMGDKHAGVVSVVAPQKEVEVAAVEGEAVEGAEGAPAAGAAPAEGAAAPAKGAAAPAKGAAAPAKGAAAPAKGAAPAKDKDKK